MLTVRIPTLHKPKGGAPLFLVVPARSKAWATRPVAVRHEQASATEGLCSFVLKMTVDLIKYVPERLKPEDVGVGWHG